MFGHFLVLFFIFRNLRKSLRESPQLAQWDQILLGGMIASMTIIGAEAVFDAFEMLTPWIAYLILLFIVYLIYKKEEFHYARSILTAVAPYFIMSFLVKATSIFDAEFYAANDNYFDAGNAFSMIWMIVMLIITNKQNKALARERDKTLEEEKQNKIMADLKAELEVQVVERTAELTQQKEELQLALNDLKVTQTQLVHSEKMASLGELTAGIAHEIQNPLNFVNNFSEINKELVEELREAQTKGDQEEIEAITKDILENENKIMHHGKRAEGIVKSMLQHSRTGSGEKELTDINALSDEYLRLAYHGLRAKDQSFNADFKTEFDENLLKVSVVPQDIGRVLLNLINNAFQAVKDVEKPLVTISTSVPSPLEGGKGGVEIRVADNGPGIPDDIKDKIFQPFFTTKPTGEGTGLGLSMSYDIVTKGHGGELKVNTKVGVGTEFIIHLPIGG